MVSGFILYWHHGRAKPPPFAAVLRRASSTPSSIAAFDASPSLRPDSTEPARREKPHLETFDVHNPTS